MGRRSGETEKARPAATSAREGGDYGELQWEHCRREMYQRTCSLEVAPSVSLPLASSPRLFGKAMLKKCISCRGEEFVSRYVGLKAQGSCIPYTRNAPIRDSFPLASLALCRDVPTPKLLHVHQDHQKCSPAKTLASASLLYLSRMMLPLILLNIKMHVDSSSLCRSGQRGQQEPWPTKSREKKKELHRQTQDQGPGL